MSWLDVFELLKSCLAGIAAASLFYWHSSRQTRLMYEHVQHQLDAIADRTMRDRVVRLPDAEVRRESVDEEVERAPLPRARLVRSMLRVHAKKLPDRDPGRTVVAGDA